jgi:amino acid adenylation domain-containing protein
LSPDKKVGEKSMAKPIPAMQCLDQLFSVQVENQPDAIAVVFNGTVLTYRELDRRADAVARRLRHLGVGADVLVALFSDRSLDMVVGVLGVLKAGGAYVPLDPTHPRKRLAYVLSDAQPLVVLTQERLQAELPPHPSHVVIIDAAVSSVAPPERAPPRDRAHSARDLAYVIYTSGSTGEPKGVEIEHHAVASMLESMQRRPGFSADDTMLALTTPAFDISVLEVFLPLVSGGRVVIADTKTIGDGDALARLITLSRANVLQATPSTLRMLLDAGWSGDPRLKILCGGEAWSADLAAQILQRCDSLWNMYGPTETTVWSAVDKVEAGRPVVIGPPIAETQFYVLDGASQLVPIGEAGELHIAGAGLARGYLRRPQLTSERFVANPFATEPGALMYRTGDLVRRLADGTLEFLGRLDHQVKIRGHRVELGEIEVAVERHPGIKRCVVVACEGERGERRLVAYVIPAAGLLAVARELRLFLGKTLPGYMVPSVFISVASFPLTPNGKLDRSALPTPDAAPQDTDFALVPPRTPTEMTLSLIWCDVLNLKQIGVRDNFFDLGGHSLLAVRVVGEINKTLKVRLNIPAFFQNPTIERLAEVLRQMPHCVTEPRLLPLREGPVGLPVYFIGAGPAETKLAALVGGDHAIYAVDIPIHSRWRSAIAAADRAALPTIEQLGALCGTIVYAHAESSPCVLAGYSLGGQIAFEAAHELRNAGGNIAFVLLLDARATTSSRSTLGPAWQSLKWIWRGAVIATAGETTWTERLSGPAKQAWRLLSWLLQRIPQVVSNRARPVSRPSGFLDESGRPVEIGVIARLVHLTRESWHPRPLDAWGILIRANDPGEEMLSGFDISHGWHGLFRPGLKIVQSAGDHASMVSDEMLPTLARQIKAMLCQVAAVQAVDTAGTVDKREAGSTIAQRRSDGASGGQEASVAAVAPGGAATS